VMIEGRFVGGEQWQQLTRRFKHRTFLGRLTA
jgi:hypothetical protein